jgi:phosphocarrier protein
MPERTVTLHNETGLHARPARVLSKAAKGFDAKITVAKTNGEADPVNAKSALSVLTLDCHQGDEIVIAADGDDADRALDELVELVQSGLGE